MNLLNIYNNFLEKIRWYIKKNDKIAYENKIDLKKNNNYPILPVIIWGMWYKGYYGGDVKNETFWDNNFLIKRFNKRLKDILELEQINYILLKSFFE